MGFARLLGGILIFAALSAPGHASSAVVTPGLSVTLAWNPTTDLTVGGYRIYYGTASGTYNKMVQASQRAQPFPA